MPRCRELNLSYNAIARIENLSAVRQLRVLNLAENKIGVIEGLEALAHLEVLDLTGNHIEAIPAQALSKHNPGLVELRLARNKIRLVRPRRLAAASSR